jgi:hypothetical protein
MPFRRKGKGDPAETVGDLRQNALTVTPEDLGLAPTTERPDVWDVLMETGYPDAVATLVCLADGTTSMYFSNGAGVFASPRASREESDGRVVGEALSRSALAVACSRDTTGENRLPRSSSICAVCCVLW